MTALSDKTIKSMIDDGLKIVDPFDPGCLQPSSIDLRLGSSSFRYNLERYTIGDVIHDDDVIRHTFTELPLKNGDVAYIGIFEKITIPNHVIGFVMPRSSITRLGIHIVPTFMNPGYSGIMPLTIVNHTGMSIMLKPGCRVAQLILFTLDSYPGRIYKNGQDVKYFDENISPSKLHEDPRFFGTHIREAMSKLKSVFGNG
jgi:dCTP deaminase